MFTKKPGIKIFFAFLFSVFMVTGTAQAENNVLAVAAGISPCVEEIMEAFVDRGGQPLILVKQSSGTLARQIDQGAPYDLFLSTDPKWRKWLLSQGHDLEFEVCALGVLTAWWPDQKKHEEIPNLSSVSIAVPNPDYTAYGKMAMEYFKSLGLWEEGNEKGRFVLCDNAPQCIVAVKSGAAEIALVPVIMAKKAGGFFLVLEGAGTLATEVLVINNEASPNTLEFRKFLCSREACRIWEKWGFVIPEGE